MLRPVARLYPARGYVLSFFGSPTSLIVLEFLRVAVLDGGIALDTVLLAEGLAGGGAIHVRDQGMGVPVKLMG